MAYTQEARLIAIDTPLGKDALLLQGFTGQEGMSQLFRYQLDLLSDNPAIPFRRIIGQRVTIRIGLTNDEERYINGFVSRFAQSGGDERFTHYQAEVVPWLWFLTRTADCRIFQNMTVPDIIVKICKDLGFSDIKNQLAGSFEPRDYCVQYRETDFNFVARLMEQYGIFYFFKHEKDKHTLVLANSATAHQPCPEQPYARFDYSGGAMLEEDIVTSWHVEQELRPGKYAMTDYNFETPSTSLAVNVSSIVTVDSNHTYEIYDYPGEYPRKGQGEDLVKVRMEEEEASHLVAHGASTCRAFLPGYRFELEGHSNQDLNKAYVLTEVRHVASVGDSYVTGAGAEERYSNTFTCICHDVPYRPSRITPKPIVQGPQTAVVVGKAGEEIWTDKYGRIKVQFHWDREGKQDENSSCWIRVSHPWAGKGWGAVAIPRIGQEVIVDFLEGDPDQPIITGRVYNAELMPPYELPANQTQSGIKSRSSKGGDTANFNEIRFEDKKGSEEVYIHAEKDENIVVEHDKTESVGHDETLSVEHDRNKTVKNNQSETVKVNKTIVVGGNHTESITGDMTQTVSSSKMETIALAKALTIGGAYQVSVGAAMNETVVGTKTEEVGAFKGEGVGGSKSETIGGSKSVSTGANLIVTVGKSETLTITEDLTERVGGKHTEQISKEYAVNAKKIQLMAEDQIVLKTGNAEIVMKKNGDIEIKGNKLQIKGSGDVIVKGSQIKEN
jgi:type VI secretion system secreted protein VgrG